MPYIPPPVPTGARDDPRAEATYLLEDRYSDTPTGALAERLTRTDRLRVKFGVDPTAPEVTWGWTVPLRRLRRFQELGHTAVLVIGDFTARVGDPSGRSTTRRRLPQSEVDEYVKACLDSLLQLLSPERLEVRRNSEWLSSMDMADVLELAATTTVAQLLERDDFSDRFAAREPISLIELTYPLLQGHDSVAVRADVELGGNDQLFNFLLARSLQEIAGQEPQVAVCGPLLVGTDGSKKMSQSVGNYIGINEPPEEIFGKAMSIPDAAVPEYVRLALDLRPEGKAAILDDHRGVTLKRRLGREMVAMFYGAEAAEAAEAAFDRIFVRHEPPTELDHMTTSERYLPTILVALGWSNSLSAGRRAIKQGGIRVDGTVVEREHHNVAPGTYVLQYGRRRFHRVTVN